MTDTGTADPLPPATRVPVTVVAGFLGSGKTTLLNHILGHQHGLKIAVIVNEIGEIGIDGELIIAAAEDMVELSNGCLCCSLNNDLVEAVGRVLNRSQSLDYLVVESTGVADPLPVVLTFLRPEFRGRLRIDSVITIVDAVNFSSDLFASRAARNQLAHADAVLLNKCDLANNERLHWVEAGLRDLNAGVRILRTTHCCVPLPLILSVGLFQSDRYSARSVASLSDHDHAQGDGAEPHLSMDGFEALSFEAERPISAEKFQFLLEHLPADVFRGKGVLWIEGSERRYIFHLVGGRFTLDEAPGSAPLHNRLVLIGRNLDRRDLHERLCGCLCDSEISAAV